MLHSSSTPPSAKLSAKLPISVSDPSGLEDRADHVACVVSWGRPVARATQRPKEKAPDQPGLKVRRPGEFRALLRSLFPNRTAKSGTKVGAGKTLCALLGHTRVPQATNTMGGGRSSRTPKRYSRRQDLAKAAIAPR